MNGNNEMVHSFTHDHSLLSMIQVNTDIATFTLVNITNNVSPPPYCNVHICVRKDPYIGCKRSLDCVVTIPSNVTTRAARSYEEPSEELLANCEQENLGPDSPVSSCSDKMWDIFYNNGYDEGEVSLRIILQGNDKVFLIVYLLNLVFKLLFID